MNETDRAAAIHQYLTKVTELFYSGHAIEHAYRGALETLINALDDVVAVNDPKRSEHGAPDFVFLKKSNQTIIRGHAEAKDITVNLDKTEKSEQMQRYHGYANLVLTDYLEFRFFRNGEKYETISLGYVKDSTLYKTPEQGDRLMRELEAFLDQTPESIRSGRRLAQIMGGKARRIRDNIAEYLNNDDIDSREFDRIYDMMKKMLVHDLTPEKFADMYAQTLVYGLFVARYGDSSPDNFTRSEARDLVPASNPFLRHFFDHIVGPNFDARLAHIVDELCEIFSVSDVQAIVHKHLKIADQTTDAKDPIIHFYEDFLQEYDPAERKKMGAYYTPIPVVKYIVRQVDRILKEDFGLRAGLASTDTVQYDVETGQDLRHDRRTKAPTHQTLTVPRVQILDPAVGTATFLNETIKFIYESFKGQEGRWPSYVNDNLVKRLHGFELMMAPYTIAHLKLGMTLRETGVDKLNDRLGVYLTNTLEEGIPSQTDIFSFGLAEAVSEESRLAAEVKNERPVMVVMGNPPYSASSANRTRYANGLTEKYKVEPGGKEKLNEKKHWLNDDYVKFIAFAEDMVDKQGAGVVAMITNHGYLDNASFRGMRWRLASTFDKIYVLDLHGNVMKKESASDGGKDENVFDIQQGVAIILAVKTSPSLEGDAHVYYADVFGRRKDKFALLDDDEIKFERLTLNKKNYVFVNRDNTGLEEYEQGVSIGELFPLGVTGIVTGKDTVTLFDSYEDCKRFVEWCKIAADYEIEGKWGKFGRGQTAKKIRDDVNDPRGRIVPILYRPGEIKWTYYTGTACGFLFWPRRKEIMGSMIPYFSASAEKDISFLADFSASPISNYNVSLVVSRQAVTDNYSHVQVSDMIVDNREQYSNKGIPIQMPLYTYHADGTRVANFNPHEIKTLFGAIPFDDQMKCTIDYLGAGDDDLGLSMYDKVARPEDILDYIYASLHSPTYRAKYKEFLKTDFPRVPRPASWAEFWRLVPLGRQLRELHLMQSADIDDYTTTYPVSGGNEVEQIKYVVDESSSFSSADSDGRVVRQGKLGRVYLNNSQYFGNVPDIAWNFYIGGYQPAQKWLKDRLFSKTSKPLSDEDLNHYQRIIRILLETDRLMQQIG